MAAYTNFRVDGTSIMNPSGFSISRYDVTNLERLANANIAGDLIAKKRKLFFTYEVIASADLDHILNLIWTPWKIFFNLEWQENGIWRSMICYKGEISQDLARAGRTTNWVWQDVSFNFIEQ